MKKHFVLLSAVAVALVCACSREEVIAVPEETSAAQAQEITISAFSADQLPTKTSRDEDGTFFWSPGDQISLFYGAGENGGWCFTSTNSEPAEQTDFTGTIDIITGAFEGSSGKKFWGVYPYNEETMCDGTILTTRVPNEQKAVAGTFADGQFISIGCSEGLSMGFYNLCGGIKFRLEQSGIRSITLRGNNEEILAGLVDVYIDEDNHPMVASIREGYTEVVLTCQDGYFEPGTDYFFVTLPVTFKNGFSVEFDNGFYRSVDVNMTINRSKFQWSENPLDYTGEDYELYEYDVLTPETRSFIDEVTYTDDYSYTEVDRFNGSDSPVPFTMSCDAAATHAWVSTSTSFMEYNKFDINSGQLEIYNLIPGVKYYVKVVDDYSTELQQFAILPVGPLRWINGVVGNMRDLGGWKASGHDMDGNLISGTIKYGRLYRGRQLDEISGDASNIFLNDLGITVDLDLRGYDSGTAKRVLNNEDCEWVNIKLQQFLGNGTGNTEELYREAIHDIIGWLFEGRNVYFHCIGGADRTGTLAFLIEALLGVSESDLSKEYELTTFSGQKRYRYSTSGYPFRSLIEYLKSNYPSDTMQDTVMQWAMTGTNALSDQEINLLQQLLLDTQ